MKQRIGETREEYLARRREYGKQYYQNHKDERVEYGKQYYQEHKEERIEYGKQYYQDNKDERVEYDKQYYQDNPEAYLLSAYRRSDTKRGRDNDLTLEFMREKIHQPCHYCGGMAEVGYNGLDRMDSNIGHLMSNCVPCCPTCNNKKKTMPYREFMEMIKRKKPEQGALSGTTTPD